MIIAQMLCLQQLIKVSLHQCLDYITDYAVKEHIYNMHHCNGMLYFKCDTSLNGKFVRWYLKAKLQP